MNSRPQVSAARFVSLGQLGQPVVLSFPPDVRPDSAADDFELVPSVCSPWDRPGPVELTRLAGLDLERCGLLVRSAMSEPLTCSAPSIAAFISAQIVCVGTNVSFANRQDLLASGLVVLEHLNLVDLPRAGFCIRVSPTEVTAIVRAYQWTN